MIIQFWLVGVRFESRWEEHITETSVLLIAVFLVNSYNSGLVSVVRSSGDLARDQFDFGL